MVVVFINIMYIYFISSSDFFHNYFFLHFDNKNFSFVDSIISDISPSVICICQSTVEIYLDCRILTLKLQAKSVFVP